MPPSSNQLSPHAQEFDKVRTQSEDAHASPELEDGSAAQGEEDHDQQSNEEEEHQLKTQSKYSDLLKIQDPMLLEQRLINLLHKSEKSASQEEIEIKNQEDDPKHRRNGANVFDHSKQLSMSSNRLTNRIEEEALEYGKHLQLPNHQLWRVPINKSMKEKPRTAGGTDLFRSSALLLGMQNGKSLNKKMTVFDKLPAMSASGSTQTFVKPSTAATDTISARFGSYVAVGKSQAETSGLGQSFSDKNVIANTIGDI